MAKYSAIGSMMYYRDNADRIAKREEIALRKELAKQEFDYKKQLAGQEHSSKMAAIYASQPSDKERAANIALKQAETDKKKAETNALNNSHNIEQQKLAQRNAEFNATLAETKRANEAKEKANQTAIENAKEEAFLDNYKDLNFINMGLQDPDAWDGLGKKDPVNLSAIASQMRKIELDNRIKERLVEYAKTALGLTDEQQIKAAISNTTADPSDRSKPFITQGTRDNLAREIIRDYSADIKENTDRVIKDGLAALSVEARKFAKQKKASTGKLPTETEVNSFLKQRAKAIFGVN